MGLFRGVISLDDHEREIEWPVWMSRRNNLQLGLCTWKHEYQTIPCKTIIPSYGLDRVDDYS